MSHQTTPPTPPCCHPHSSWFGRLAWLCLFLALGCQPSQAADPPGKRMALVIGNARYTMLPLNNPENDARVMASTLRRLGFDVAEHVNLGGKELRQVLREFSRRVQNNEGAAVLYYAGHGVQIEGRNYLLPVDINLRDEDEVRGEGVDIDDALLYRLERARAQVRVIILDACRDNPFAPRQRAVRGAGGLAEMAARGALIAYATAPGATAEDGAAGTNSVFTRHLAIEMLAEGVEVEQMFKNVRVKVMRDTQQRQMPWVNSSLTADFSFNPARSSATPGVARPDEVARLRELLEKRDREQRALEDQVRELMRERLGKGQSSDDVEGARPAAKPQEPAPRVVQAAPAGQPLPPPPAPAATIKPAPALRPSGGKAAAPTERCVSLLIRAQLGEPVSPADMAYLQKECR